MPKIIQKDKAPGRDTTRKRIVAKTTNKPRSEGYQLYQWWLEEKPDERAQKLVTTFRYLEKNQNFRLKKASSYSRLYSGKPLFNYAMGSKQLDTSNQLPIDRPTMNVTYSCIDSLVSKISQSKPKPVFLTDGGHYKERTLSKQMNAFIQGEFFRCKAYEKGTYSLRDACIFGDGLVKILEKDRKVALEKTLSVELFTDSNDAYHGSPRQLIQVKLTDRAGLAATFPKAYEKIMAASNAVVNAGTNQSNESITDQIIIVEGWHLPTGSDPTLEGYVAGRHTIACNLGEIFDEVWDKEYFPFAKLPYNHDVVGWWSQSLAELLMGTQMEINKLLITMAKSIHLVGVPRIFIDEMAKVLETAFNNNVGTIIKYRGTKPSYEVAQCIPQEMYDHLLRLINFAYQVSGVSQLAAASQKPAGLNSGESLREYNAIQTDRFASLQTRYQDFYVDLSYKMIDKASDIAKRDGKYSTIYPNKDGTRQIDLPKAVMLKDFYVIQCYDESYLPQDPAGRQAKLSEQLAAGEITLTEFRRLSAFPDLEQSDSLANALEDRILQILDGIVEDGKYIQPDPFLLDPEDMATKRCVQYINKYAGAQLEEKKMQLLRDFFTQVQTLKNRALQPPPVPPQPGQPAAPGPQGNIQQPPPVPPAAPISPVSQVNPGNPPALPQAA
jgi:hypothetical protein